MIKQMRINSAIDLSDVTNCPAAIIEFYNRYREKIADIETITQRNEVLSDMQNDFEKSIRNEPQLRDKLSETYEFLKMKCWEVELLGNQ